MRKLLISIILCVFLLFFTSCKNVDKENSNFLGGYGNISEGAYATDNVNSVFEDDVYIYYDAYKINKNSGKILRICENAGCKHDNPNCKEYQYGKRVFPCDDNIFYTQDKELYSIDNEGKTTYIDKFDVDENGILLDDYVVIEMIKPINEKCIYIMCGDGSCIYNLDTKKRIYTYANFIAGDNNNIYYYDNNSNSIVKAAVSDFSKTEINNTRWVYPVCCAEGKVFCNTRAGTICYLDSEEKINIILDEEGINYNLLGISNNKMYYSITDFDVINNNYTFYDLYCDNTDGSDSEKLNTDKWQPEGNCIVFFNGDNLYFLNNQDMKINSMAVYSISDSSYKEYTFVSNASNGEASEMFSEDIDNNEEDMNPKAVYTAIVAFYSRTKDEISGKEIIVSQYDVPFVVDDKKLKTTFCYNFDVDGRYPKEGKIYIFVVCDGILQEVSVNGNEAVIINEAEYIDGKDMTAELEFTIKNPSKNGKIAICYYLSDYIITDKYEEFGEYREMINYSEFTYELADGYNHDSIQREAVTSNYDFKEIYTLEDGQEFSDIELINYEFAALYNAIPIGKQDERWNIELKKGDDIYMAYRNIAGEYVINMLIDDKIVPLSEEESLLVSISGDHDSVVYKMNIDNLIHDNEKHSVKLIVFDKTTGRVNLMDAQIIQVKE